MSELELTDTEAEFFVAGMAFEEGEIDPLDENAPALEKRSFWQRLFRRAGRR